MTALLIDAGEFDARLIGRAFGERVAMLVREKSYSDAARLLERLSSLGAGSKFKPALSGGLTLGLRPAAITFDAATQAGDDQLAELQEMIDALIEEMVSPAVIGASVVDNRERRRLVLARLELRGATALHGAVSALATTPPEPASLDLVAMLERAADAGIAGLETALAHESPRVRQEALKALLRIETAEQAKVRCLAAIEGADAHLRRVAVDHAVVARISEAAPRLRRLAMGEHFDELEYADKKRILSGLASLGGSAVREIFVKALHQRNLLRRQQIEETRIAAACALAFLRDRETRDEIRALRDRTGPPHRMELDQACLIYDRQTAPEEIASREASARLGSQPPATSSRGTAPRGLPVAEPGPPNIHKMPTRPVPTKPVSTDAEGNIDLDSEPPLLPTSHVSVPHAQGSRTPATRPRSRPPETAPAAPAPAVAPEPLPRSGSEELPADVVDLVSGHRKDE